MRHRAPRFPKTFRTVSTTPAASRAGPETASARTASPPILEGVLPSEGNRVVLAIFLEDEIAYLMSEGVLRPTAEEGCRA